MRTSIPVNNLGLSFGKKQEITAKNRALSPCISTLSALAITATGVQHGLPDAENNQCYTGNSHHPHHVHLGEERVKEEEHKLDILIDENSHKSLVADDDPKKRIFNAQGFVRAPEF